MRWLVACLKGLLAGAFNTALAIGSGPATPPAAAIAGSLVVGLLGYGLSLTLFVLGLRTLGTARTGAYFSAAPLFCVAISLAPWPQIPPPVFWLAAGLMAVGVWLHVRERHLHEHTHEALQHANAGHSRAQHRGHSFSGARFRIYGAGIASKAWSEASM